MVRFSIKPFIYDILSIIIMQFPVEKKNNNNNSIIYCYIYKINTSRISPATRLYNSNNNDNPF